MFKQTQLQLLKGNLKLASFICQPRWLFITWRWFAPRLFNKRDACEKKKKHTNNKKFVIAVAGNMNNNGKKLFHIIKFVFLVVLRENKGWFVIKQIL